MSSTTSVTDPEPEHNVEETDNAPAADDEDTGAQIAPIVKLEEVAVSTGEEDEDPVIDLKAKLYRFDKDGNQWKERGVGSVKLLKHKETGKVRLVMRQSKTLKICANHLVLPSMNVQVHHGNDKSCVWHATDFADGELKDELFCIRFASVENCKTFMETVQEIAESQEKREESQEATDTAQLLKNLNVADGNDEAKEKKEPAESKESSGAEGEKAKEQSRKDEEAPSSA